MGSDPLKLAIIYQPDDESKNIRSCSFSECGSYFAFMESDRVTAVYQLPAILAACSSTKDPTDFTNEDAYVAESDWHAVNSDSPSGSTNKPISLSPISRISCYGSILCVKFAHGELDRSRLPHRRSKRVSRLIQDKSVTLLLFGLVTGRIEIYNARDFAKSASRVPNLSLQANNMPIYAMTVHTDGSLRVATVHRGGEVLLWDLWDDGNMYANMKSHFSFPVAPCNGSYHGRPFIVGEACTFAWQPNGDHACMAGEHGWGVIVQSEKPFDRVAALYSGHHNRIIAASYTHDSSILLTTSYDSCTAAWAVPEYTLMHRFWHVIPIPSLVLLGGSNGHHLYDMALSPDGLHFVTICEDRCVRLWQLSCAKSPLATHADTEVTRRITVKPRSIAFSPCGRLLAVSTSDNRVLIFSIPSQRNSLKLQCSHVIRTCITHYLTTQYPDQIAAIGSSVKTNKAAHTSINDATSSSPDIFNLHFCKAVSKLPLPAKLRDFLLCNFTMISNTQSQP